MTNEFNRKIVLEDGSEYYGSGFGGGVPRVCELVFNTSIVGYQEIVSDPSYTFLLYTSPSMPISICLRASSLL